MTNCGNISTSNISISKYSWYNYEGESVRLMRWLAKQSGRTPWLAAALCGERKALWRECDTVPGVGLIIGQIKLKLN